MMACWRHSSESGNPGHKQTFTENFLRVTIQKMVSWIPDLLTQKNIEQPLFILPQ
jgi:hypothetical protein